MECAEKQSVDSAEETTRERILSLQESVLPVLIGRPHLLRPVMLQLLCRFGIAPLALTRRIPLSWRFLFPRMYRRLPTDSPAIWAQILLDLVQEHPSEILVLYVDPDFSSALIDEWRAILETAYAVVILPACADERQIFSCLRKSFPFGGVTDAAD